MRSAWLVSVAFVFGFGAVVACGGDTDLITASSTPSGDGGSGPGESACQELEQCCEESLPPSEQPQCDTVVSANDASICNQALAAAHSAGFCSTLGIGTGSGSGTGVVMNGSCASLEACCESPSLPPATQASCENVVAVGSADSCASALEEATAAGVCGSTTGTGSGSGSGGNGTSCASLAACCATSAEGVQAACEMIVEEGDDDVCSAELSAFEADGLCGS